MKGAELILRYFAFRQDRENYEKPLASFLDNFSSKNKNLNKEDVKKWSADFLRVIDLVDYALGKYSFRLFEPNLTAVTAFNSALYDAEMIAFAETTNKLINSKSFEVGKFRSAVGTLFKNERFYNSVRQATSDEQSVKTRMDLFKKFLGDYNGL